MDEEDIAVPSGSLNNRLGVVYEASQPGTDGWKRIRRFTMRSDTWGVPQNQRPLRQVTPVNYNGAAHKLPEGVTMSNLENALRELREKRSQAQMEIDKLDQIISGIESLNGAAAAVPSKTAQPKRVISAASRRKMALAQKARWANARKGSQPVVAIVKSTGSAPAKRTMSASARRKIAAAQK